MRRTIAAVAALLASTLAGEARAQYGPSYYVVQAPAPHYVYVYSPQSGYRTIVPPYSYAYQSPPARRPNPTGYQNRPYYGAYGYGNSSNGSTDGFPPFRGRGWR